MTVRPRVSVLMPAFNAERFLAPAVDSVLGQSHEDLELVVVDDGSTDHTFELLQEYARKDPRVRALRNEQNLGIVHTRNRAFAEADPRSAFFALMDSDDVCEPARLALQLDFLSGHPDHALVGGNLILIDEAGAELGRRLYPSSYEAITSVITRFNPIAQPTATVRRSAIDAVGTYDVRYPRCQDYDLWLRVARRFKIANLPAFTLRYRISQTQGKATALRESLKQTLNIQREYMFEPQFFRARNIAYWVAQHGLFALPESVVLALWKRAVLKTSDKAEGRS
jgi:glycosyltransferase involved in cell wall biosynthesis